MKRQRFVFIRHQSYWAVLAAGVALAAVLAAGSPVAAQEHLSVVDSFNYTPGELDGQGGGNNVSGIWTDGWTGDDGFTVYQNRIYVTSSDPISISRPFDLQLGMPGNAPLGHPFWFSVELTEVAPLGDHQVGLTFYDSPTTPTAEIGLKRDSGTGYFYARLGSGSYLTSAVPTIQVNTPYNLVGQIEFNVAGLGDGLQERLTLWVNAGHEDLTNYKVYGTPNYVLQTTGDLGFLGAQERLSLGNSVTLTSTLTPGDPVLIDDLRIGQQSSNTMTARFDIGGSSQAVQEGFIPWDASASFSKVIPGSQLGWTHTQMTATLEGYSNPLTPADVIDAGAMGGVAEQLRRDGVQAVGGLKLTLDGLSWDPFVVKTYHNLLSGTPNGKIRVTLNSPNGPVLALIDPTTGADWLGAEATVYFETNESSSIYTLYYLPVDENGDWLENAAVAINGFEIVPEPSTWALLIMGAAGGLFCWRRRRA